MKKFLSIFLAAMLLFSSVTIDTQAKTPEIMSALKSHIATHGKIVQKSVAFSLWEKGLEQKATLSLRNFGFNKITVFDSAIYAREWK